MPNHGKAFYVMVVCLGCVLLILSYSYFQVASDGPQLAGYESVPTREDARAVGSSQAMFNPSGKVHSRGSGSPQLRGMAGYSYGSQTLASPDG